MILKPYYNQNITIFAQTNFRDQRKNFGIKQADRRKHMYIIGKTGMGKTSMLQHMIVQDIKAGHGICVFDSNRELIKQVLHYIPQSRVHDVIYFNPTDINYPIAFNLLDQLENQDLIVSLMSIFKDLWKDIWCPRLEYIFKNTLLTLAVDEKNTILHILPFFTDQNFRKKILKHLNDPILQNFWSNEYQNSPERFQYQAIEPLCDKIGQIISNPMLRNIIGQAKTSFSFKKILEQKKIVLITLNKNEVGQDIVKLLGSCFILKLFLQAKAINSIDGLDADSDFYLYIDEFQNLSGPQLLEIVSASNYGLNLILANQYLNQLSPSLVQAILGNIGTIVAFRLGARDANVLADEFQPGITSEDLIKLPKHHIILKLSIDGEVSKPFTAISMSPLPTVGLADKIIQYSRKTYTNQRAKVEDLIVKSLHINKKPSKPLTKITKKPKTKISAEQIHSFREKLSQIKSHILNTPNKKDQKYKKLEPGEEAIF